MALVRSRQLTIVVGVVILRRTRPNLHYVVKLSSYEPLYDLEANHLAISELQYGTISDLSNLLPPTHGRS